MSRQPVSVVLCTCPPDAATRIARQLLEERLVACVNVVAGVKSLYWWKGEVAEDGESLLVLKTSRARFGALEARLREVHPYEVPEILSLPVDDGSESYVSWVLESTAS